MEVTSAAQKTGTILPSRDNVGQSDKGVSFATALNQATSGDNVGSEGQSTTAKPWSAPWLSDAPVDDTLLLPVDEYTTRKRESRLNDDKPNLREFMDKANVDAKTASDLLYGTLGAAPDMRNWAAIMESDNPAKAARQATVAQLNSASHADYIGNALKTAGYKPVESNKIVAKAGNFAVINEGTKNGQPQLALKVVDANNQISRGISWSAQDVYSTAEEYGLDLEPLKQLADELDKKGVNYMPGSLYAGSDHGVNLREVAAGGMGSAYDWTQDSLISVKGDAAFAQYRFNQLLASRLGLKSE